MVGIEIGYDKNQLARQDLIGSVLLLLKSPVSIWWHLISKTSSVIDSYVPKPGEDAYYINNIAVSPTSVEEVSVGYCWKMSFDERVTMATGTLSWM